MNKFIIDTYTKGHGALVSKLRKLKTTKEASFNGVYHQDETMCQIIVETEWSEDQLNHWLWESKGVDYIGVCPWKEKEKNA